MLGFFRKTRPLVHDHWYALIPDFKISTAEFYDSVDSELHRREIPDLEVCRIPFPEGSILSLRREYLRIQRERLLFEICAAPFGTSWFFSCRFSEFPLRFRLLHVLLLLVAGFGVWLAYSYVFGMFWGPVVMATSLLGLIFLLKRVVPMGLFDLDHRILHLPILGPLYEIFLRPNTYFREDTRLMYCDLVGQIVRAKIEEFAGRSDIRNVEFKKDDQILSGGNGQLAGLLKTLWAGLKKK